MTATTPPRTAAVTRAQDQTSLAPDRLLHTGNAGFVIYRQGRFNYEFAEEGRGFSVDLLRYMNDKQAGVASTYCYEEVFGVRDRLHWLIHLRSPNEYRKLLDMVDHDKRVQQINTVDRLPEKGHGNWERIFVEGSIEERVLVPQHGLGHHHDEEAEVDNYVPSARNQTSQPLDVQLNSANAGAIVLRTAHVKYEFREEGRLFAYDWQEHVNRELAGSVTVLLFEENFGKQDRIYSMIHLREPDDYWRLVELDRSPATAERVHRKQRIHDSKGGGTWQRLFVQDSVRDTLLLPQAPGGGKS
ncbi:DUF6039 family protein [Saccharothrix coeruleofusca]|uniref:Uncharacterized protein n=1 Tax=Saccharothrix coeruleofusca TaxID=33919 RepID=A0A918AU63_9PSEU|nr:DUF6039 family protein [Saccharothrix coeruleofusca]MBP2336634.1 hypothetical protein [Saccharothrix coeruleofusca]GGP51583.1 hypothetical protein GCM10010185_24510 [Saccharothrix coeruleofusca]GGP84915.1 hypothetical protein GCM10010185_68430 [Saccharothrix coeruleofusca]